MNPRVLLDKVIDAGTNTIWSEIQKLRGHALEHKERIRRRWVWELVQNASDCAFPDKGVNISVRYEVEAKEFYFTHDGKPFTYANLLDLITQISSKQRDDEEKTGKFGTGFISTHLLSETVKLTSVLQCDDGTMKNFECTIDRSGTEYQKIRDNIQKNLNDIEAIAKGNNTPLHENDKCLTTFTYCINSDADEAVLEGLKDLENATPFILSLNPTINSIDCNGIDFKAKSSTTMLNGDLYTIETKFLQKNFMLLHKKQDNISLVFPVQQIGLSKYRLLPYPENFPKLFCNFPLIGTEKFTFPVIINCANFKVEKDRNAIHEGNSENIQILKTATDLYFSMLDYVVQNQYEDVYNICFCEKNTETQFKRSLYQSVFDKIARLPMIKVHCNGKESGSKSFLIEQEKQLQKQIYIPKTDRPELNDEFWGIVNNFSSFYIPSLSIYKEWGKIFNNEITVHSINNRFKGKHSTEIDKSCNCEWFQWLNSFYSFWMKISKPESFLEDAFILNQNQIFKLANTLFIDKDIDEVLKDVLTELGENIRESLIAEEIILPAQVTVKSKDNKCIAKCIQDKINKLLSDETMNNIKRENKTQLTFNKLTNWFLANQDKGSELFDTLYNKRNMLSTIEENIRRFKIAEKIESKNIMDTDLDLILSNSTKIVELLQNHNGLSAEEIKEELQHISSHNNNALEYHKEILERTIINVHRYLTETGLYTISNTVEDWKKNQYSSTVFCATKQSKELRIIVRPSDGNKIIFYNDEELAALDDTDYELWTDSGTDDTRIITLGDILKTTGITKIPLRHFYR